MSGSVGSSSEESSFLAKTLELVSDVSISTNTHDMITNQYKQGRFNIKLIEYTREDLH